jgi:hypothetical protein
LVAPQTESSSFKKTIFMMLFTLNNRIDMGKRSSQRLALVKLYSP